VQQCSVFTTQCGSRHTGHGRNVGRRMVLERSYCCRMGVEWCSNRGRILVVSTAERCATARAQRQDRAVSRTRARPSRTRRSSATRRTAATTRANGLSPRNTSPIRTSRPRVKCRPTPPTAATSTASRSTRRPPADPRTADVRPDSSRLLCRRHAGSQPDNAN